MRNWRHTWERFWGGHYRALGCLHLDRAAQIDYLFLQRIGRPLYAFSKCHARISQADQGLLELRSLVVGR